MDSNSYEHSGHYFCKLVQRLQKQEFSQEQCMAHIIYNPHCCQRGAMLSANRRKGIYDYWQLSPLQKGEHNTE